MIAKQTRPQKRNRKKDHPSGKGICVRLPDGRILTLEEARKELLERYWAQ